MKHTPIIILVVIALGLIVWGTATNKNTLRMFGDTEVACLSNGHQSVAAHIHPHLSITVDGEKEPLPANIGIIAGCMSETHTHDTTGTLHIESADADRINRMHLGHFFSAWGKSHQRAGYTLEIIQDGTVKSSIEDVRMTDRSTIELNYTSQ